MTSKIIINDYFYQYLFNENRYLILYGGAGSGKSHFAAQKVITKCLNEPNHRILIVRKIARTIEESVYKQIYGLLSTYNLLSIVKTNKTEKSFTFPNGSEIITTGMDDPEKIKSIYRITGIWIEEATELDIEDFNQLDLRLRGITEYYKQIIITFNPIDEMHWIKKEFFDTEQEDATIIHSTFLNNKFLDDEYIKMIKNRIGNNENLRRIYLEGRWGHITTGTEYYSSFNRIKHVGTCKYDVNNIIHCTFDQNVVPYYSGLVIQLQNVNNIWQINVIKEFTLKNPNNKADKMAIEILNNFTNLTKIYYYGDASGNKQDTRNKFTDYDIMRNIFKKYITNNSDRTMRINPLHKKRHVFINDILDNKLPIRLTIDNECKQLITDLEMVKEDVNGGILKEIARDKITNQSYEKYGHLSDALCYFIIQAFRQFYDNYKFKN